MMSALRTSAIVIVLTLVGAMVGGWAGVRYGLRDARAPTQLDELLHSRLHLSAAQQQQLAALEADYAMRRGGFEAEMRTANQELARAITVRHQYDADAKAAISRLHRAMEGLQEATVQHVLAMRAVLTSDQARQFDQTVDQALAAAPP